jgi:hypothetical protein
MNKLKKHLDKQNMISEELVHKHFEIMENRADGNCLFESIEQLHDVSAEDLRHYVCIFYKFFDFHKLREENTLEEMLYFAGLAGDNVDYDVHNKPRKTPHSQNICSDKEYAGIMDIIVIAMIVQRPIFLFHLIGDKYKVDEYSHKSFLNHKEPIYIKFDGEYHFEALMVKQKSRSRSNSRSKSKSNSNSKSSQNTKKHLKSPSNYQLLLYRSLMNQIKFENDLSEDEKEQIRNEIQEMESKYKNLKKLSPKYRGGTTKKKR